MNKNIDEILQNLKDKYDEIGEGYYPEDLFSPKDPKILYDYIISLQERNNKAIEYLKLFDDNSTLIDHSIIKGALNILKGEDKE